MSTARILVVGNGGREHALAWRLTHEGHEVLAAPGRDGYGDDARCVPVHAGDSDAAAALVRRARDEGVDLVVVGPEQPLCDGLADRLRDAGLPTVGPGAAAAELEGSKAAAKRFMAMHGIPTARHETVTTLDEGLRALERFEAAPVVKADGLAAGKGVTVASTHDEARAALVQCLEGGAFGAAGRTVVLEERLRGQEVSLFVLTDGTGAATFLPAQDHKRLGEGDTGPNTGGMGAYAPAPIYDAAVAERVRTRIVGPTLAGLRAEGRPFRGVLFVGLMIDDAGEPWVIEYNCRFGDPEVQPLLFGLSVPLLPRLADAAHGMLRDEALPGDPAATVVLAAAGYPGEVRTGDRIEGLSALEGDPDVKVFHAGTRREGDGWATAGGRVLGVCARGTTLGEALDRAHAAAGRVRFDGRQLRRDIGARAR
ncbi:phosphoribosylamine--glycine ligase [Paraliomyxa miuraensis]|uniref:phosphoribosylamine--glycine ligase n=1 Tax=Paraliomyxa miuraensis TaxID=376150 RepID=UPI00225B6362|nr:phosphoribosylamine--glycine ligase [Paraliomyxa miuraensis]MCX4242350.1 phosphoribosylamine--glycine ligase [Paraliomyxa miuraensis]